MTQNQISYFKAKEDQRHNLAMEAEQARANRAQEQIKSLEAQTAKEHYERSDYETNRANLTKEAQNAVTLGQNYMKIDQDTYRLQQDDQRIAETQRHNQALEAIDWYNAGSKAIEAQAKLTTASSTSALNRAKELESLDHSTLLAQQALTEEAKRRQMSYQNVLTTEQAANTMMDTELKRSTNAKVIMETSVIPVNAIGGLFRNLAIGGMIR